MDEYDAIVIGSGVGGLAAAAILTDLGQQRVLVLERHFRLGGFTHEFQRKGYRWDVGLHYVGNMAPGQTSRGVMDLVTGGTVEWDRMPDDFEVFHYPGLDFPVPSDPRAYRDRLVAAFPEEEAGIDQFFADCKRANEWYGREAWAWSLGGSVEIGLDSEDSPDRKLSLSTTEDHLASIIEDPRLRALLASQWGDYGLPPSKSAFAMHAMIVEHYLTGGYFPRGGSEAIAMAASKLIEAGGGSCRINHEVTSLIVEEGRVVGVKTHVRKGKGGFEQEFRAPIVISDAGAHTTYSRLLPEGNADELRERVEAAEPSVSCVTVYLGLKFSPEEIGFRGENHWWFEGFDHDEMFTGGQSVLAGQPKGCYLSFPSLKDSEATRHTAEIITFCDWEDFTEWEETEWLNRGEAYEALKERIATGLIDYLDERHPGLADLIDHVEVSTPLTVEAFTGHRVGQIYGLAATPARMSGQLVAAKSPVPGLFIAGADACSDGIMGALMGGVFAAGEALGKDGFFTIMGVAKERSKAQASS
jgi:all-trans-retinol 13,14-reductase